MCVYIILCVTKEIHFSCLSSAPELPVDTTKYTCTLGTGSDTIEVALSIIHDAM